MKTTELVAYLDDYLQTKEVPDYSDACNGLQVEGGAEIRRIAFAVDACLATIEAAVALEADLLIVHHGLFWGQKAPLTGAYYRRVERLIRGDLALYSSHIPLDAHIEVGNNHVLTRKLGFEPDGRFLNYKGCLIGAMAETDISLEELVARLRTVLEVEPFVMAKGGAMTGRLGVCTGGAGSEIRSAHESGITTFVTGEGAHHTYFDAEELGMNVIYAGHYATETIGVRALAEHLEARFGLETRFIPHPTGL